MYVVYIILMLTILFPVSAETPTIPSRSGDTAFRVVVTFDARDAGAKAFAVPTADKRRQDTFILGLGLGIYLDY